MSLSRSAALALAFAALNGLVAVILGAWSAHGLGEPERGWVATAAQYQMWHALAILAATLFAERLVGWPRRLVFIAIVAFVAGILLFSGGLVALAAGHRTGVAPFGGLALMLGWLLLGTVGGAALLSRGPAIRRGREAAPGSGGPVA